MVPRRVLGAAFALALLSTLPAGVGGASAANLPTGFQDEVAFEGLNEPTNFKSPRTGAPLSPSRTARSRCSRKAPPPTRRRKPS